MGASPPKVRMLHPSSGRQNFNRILNQTAARNNPEQASQSTNQNTTRMDNKKEIEEKTQAAIQAALASQPLGSSDGNHSHK